MADSQYREAGPAPHIARPDNPDIFDMLEGGEDEGTVRFLLGFNGDEASLLSGMDGLVEFENKFSAEGGLVNGLGSGEQTFLPPAGPPPAPQPAPRPAPILYRPAQPGMSKKRDTSGSKAIHNCDSCGKSFTTKFNLKRHINMHCHKSKENGVPLQGPPSASAPAKKSDQHKGVAPPVAVFPMAARPVSHYVPPVSYSEPQQAGAGAQHCFPPRVLIPVSAQNFPSSCGPDPDPPYRLPSVQTLLPASGTNTQISVSGSLLWNE